VELKMEINIKTDAKTLGQILGVLNELPTKVNVWPVVVDWTQQAEAQLNAPKEEEKSE
jgi:hypothetical protein